MVDKLSEVLTDISERFRDDILNGARHYLEVNIGTVAEKMGYGDVKEKYKSVNAVVPLKRPFIGMKVRIDGRTFVDYAQFETGVVVPGYLAREAGLPYKAFVPNDSMILNFA